MNKKQFLTHPTLLLAGLFGIVTFADGQSRPEPAPVRHLPETVTAVFQVPRAKFRITLNGFRVNRETNDDILGADGAGDEILNTIVLFTVDADESLSYPLYRGYGGLVTKMRTGTDYPSREALTRRTTEPRGLNIPLIYTNQELTAYKNAVVIIPSIFEKDNQQTELWTEFTGNLRTAQPQISRVVRSIIAGTNVNRFRHSSLDSLRNFVALTPGVFGIGPKTRPIGMVKDGDKLVYRPEILVFTYAAAEEAARTDYGQGRGIIEVKYDEDQSLAGSYVLYIQVEKN